MTLLVAGALIFFGFILLAKKLEDNRSRIRELEDELDELREQTG